ncbi:pre-mRNA-splicing factor 38B [Anopheles moucheti]|uniref:pre-mRNA-splicing factor 38B n=1 Tax=Anopheles moucheti TaxID=186751 RepID=UPI0022F11AEF|nr:pre-mRNA-splicing factor 38B [Anopheles moucheti]
MMPEEDEEMTSGGGGGVGGDGDGQQSEHQHAEKQGSSRNAVERSYNSSSNRDRDNRYDDDYHHRSNRDRDRERSHRDHRDHRDRHRDRDHRDRDHGGRYRDHYRDHRDDYRDRRDKRSRSRSKESRSRDRDRYRSQRDDRASRDAPRTERTVQDRLSAEIEQELANLRRQHDMKEALKKQQQQEEDKEKASNNEDDSQDDSKATGSGSRTSTGTHFTGHFTRKQNSSSFLPKNDSGQPVEYVPEIQTEEERIEFQRKMQEKLQQHLAAEGKLYPPPAKPQRDAPAPISMTGFANDGSFLEMFKKLQQQTTTGSNAATVPMLVPTTATGIPPGVKPMMVPTAALPRMPLVAQKAGPFKMGPTVPTAAVSQVVKSSAIDKEPPPPVLPVFGRRRGGKILKTGMVKKVRPVEESTTDAPNDAWTLYLQEVKKYKSASCDADSKTRPLVK